MVEPVAPTPTAIADWKTRLIASPRIVDGATTRSPFWPKPRFCPSISIRMTVFEPWFGALVFAEAPGCV